MRESTWASVQYCLGVVVLVVGVWPPGQALCERGGDTQRQPGTQATTKKSNTRRRALSALTSSPWYWRTW